MYGKYKEEHPSLRPPFIHVGLMGRKLGEEDVLKGKAKRTPSIITLQTEMPGRKCLVMILLSPYDNTYVPLNPLILMYLRTRNKEGCC